MEATDNAFPPPLSLEYCPVIKHADGYIGK